MSQKSSRNLANNQNASAKNSTTSLDSPTQFVAVSLVYIYQHLRGALATILIAAFGVQFQCKHSPTCSEYAIASIRRYGTMRGSLKGFARILSCY